MKNLYAFMLPMLLILSITSFAQKTHKVGPKETIYSIGRDYQVHPRELAEYNHIDITKGLSIGQIIKIPAEKKMKPVEASAPATSSPKETPSPVKTVAKTRKPIYHTLKKQENLFQVRMQYNKVPMDSLKKWNNLTSDNVKEGTQLIVGYEREAIATPVKTEAVVKTETPPPPPVEVKTTEPIPAISQSENIATESKENQPVSNQPITSQTDTSLVASLSSTVSTPQKPDDSEGYFKSAFKLMGTPQSQTGMAASFKSTSGWDDKRYYCLHNSIAPGTIIKVTNTANQKVAYAKVLDAMPDLESNKELVIRISKAMAENLGISTDKAEVRISY